MHNIKADRGLQQQANARANAKGHRDLEKEARKKKVQPLTPDDWQAAERVYQQGEITPRRGAQVAAATCADAASRPKAEPPPPLKAVLATASVLLLFPL